MKSRNSPLFIFCTLIPAINWALVPSQLENLAPGFSVGYRFILAGLLVLAFAKYKYPNAFTLTKSALKLCLLQGVFLFCLSFNLLYMASQYIVTGLVAVISSMIVIPTILGHFLIYKKKPTSPETLSALIGVFGVFLLFLPDLDATGTEKTLWGIMMALCAMFCTLIGYDLSQRMITKQLNLVWTTGYGMVSGGIFSLIIALYFNQGHLQVDTSLPYLLGLLYSAALSSAMAFCLYFTLSTRVGPNKASYVWILVPLIALNLSAFFEDFIWTSERLVGCSLIVLGGLILRSKIGQTKASLNAPLKKTSP